MEFCDTFIRDKHIQYIVDVGKDKDSLEAVMTEHMRMSGAYWGLCALEIMNAGDAIDKEELTTWVLRCQNEDGGFGGNEGYDSTLVYTLSALQILAMCDKLNLINTEKVTSFIMSLYQENGSFFNDPYGEVDLRIVYCGVCSLAILGQLDKINKEKTCSWASKCQNSDGGFGSDFQRESHSGMVFCGLSVIVILKAQRFINVDNLRWWLRFRQVDSGGLNGRPEKQCDLCYSWWTLSAMKMLDSVMIDKEGLIRFILKCQDPRGGMSDRPMDERDLYHTFFGIAGMNMLGYLEDNEIPSTPIHPVFAIPIPVVERLGMNVEIIRD